MCPSYMATREEEHATRGRANALVKALSSPDPHAALGDERLHEILDLCLECKACKSECPLSVDMASLKAEFLSHYQDIHGVPLRSRLFGAIRPLNRAGAALAPVSNLPARAAGGARAARAHGWASTAAARCPRFAREHLVRWDRRRSARARRRARRRRLPRRLLHHLHRARDRPRRDRAARGGRLARAAGERRLLRAGEHLQGPARPGARDGRRHGGAAGARRRARRADRRLRALVPAHAARGAPGLLPDDPRAAAVARPGPAGRGAAGRGDRRRRAAIWTRRRR